MKMRKLYNDLKFISKDTTIKNRKAHIHIFEPNMLNRLLCSLCYSQIQSLFPISEITNRTVILMEVMILHWENNSKCFQTVFLCCSSMRHWESLFLKWTKGFPGPLETFISCFFVFLSYDLLLEITCCYY